VTPSAPICFAARLPVLVVELAGEWGEGVTVHLKIDGGAVARRV